MWVQAQLSESDWMPKIRPSLLLVLLVPPPAGDVRIWLVRISKLIPDGEERDLLILVVVVSEILSLLGGGISRAVFFCANPGTRGIRITTKFVDSWSPDSHRSS